MCSLPKYLGGPPVDTSASTQHLLLIVWIIKRRAELTAKTSSCYLETICFGGLNDLQLEQSCVTSVPILHNRTLIYWDCFPRRVFNLFVVFSLTSEKHFKHSYLRAPDFPKRSCGYQIVFVHLIFFVHQPFPTVRLSLCVMILSARSSGAPQPFNSGVLAFCGISFILLCHLFADCS